jgi:4-amino-4-deoxy-L-arabinose transferase-like glycosyltransferase
MAVKPWTYYLAILLVASSILCFVNLGKISLWNNNEPRYAHTARNMLESGDWITPQYKGKLRTDKPILTYWLIAASSKLLNHGNVSEFSARFPFALLGVLGVLVAFFFGASLGGARAGFISGFALLFTNEYILTVRRSIPDMALCFFILLTLFLFYKGYSSQSRKGLFYLLAYIPAALGFLTKGPVAVIILGGTAFIYLAVRRDLRELKRLLFIPGIVLFLVATLPWFLMVGPKFSKGFFLLHNIKHGFIGLDHQQPWYFYFQSLPVCFAPASLFLPAGVWLWLKERDRANSPFLLPLIWFFLTLLIFSMAAAKRVVYLLPAAPALALLTGMVINRFWEGELGKGFSALAETGIGLSFLCLAVAPFLPMYFKLHTGGWLPALAIIPISLFILHILKRPEAKTGAFVSLGLLFFAAYALYFIHYQPQYDRFHRSAKPLAARIKMVVDGAPLYRMGSFDAALEFYLGRPYLPKISDTEGLEEAFLKTPKRFFIITRAKHWGRLDKAYKSKLQVVFTNVSRRKRFVLLESPGPEPSR